MSERKRTPSGGYAQDWPAYTASRLNEKCNFLRILYELCKEIKEPNPAVGRPPCLLRDVVFCLVLKVYLTLSSARLNGDLGEAKAAGLITKVPGTTSVSEHLRKLSLTHLLQRLLIQSSLPLASIEKVFAADSTSFGLPHRRDWYNRHKKRTEKRRYFAKLHVMCGVATNVITCAIPTEGNESDRNYLKLLIAGTARYFQITEVSADAGYMSAENMREVLLAGALPYIAFTKNCAVDANYKSRIWKDLLYLFKTKHNVFTSHYFLRNNVEATFSSMKARFRARLRSKSTQGQFNEMICLAIAHNICVLNRAMYLLGIDPMSWSQVSPKAKVEPEVAFSKREKDLAAIRLAAAPRETLDEEDPPALGKEAWFIRKEHRRRRK